MNYTIQITFKDGTCVLVRNINIIHFHPNGAIDLFERGQSTVPFFLDMNNTKKEEDIHEIKIYKGE